MSSSLPSRGWWFGDGALGALVIVAMLRREEADMDLETGFGDFCAALDEELERERRCCKGRCDDGCFC